MLYRAHNGKTFHHAMQGRRYDRSLAERSQEDVAHAPGGPNHEHNIKLHGPVKQFSYSMEGMGRHRVVLRHADGFKSTSVHPEAFRAYQVAGQALGLDQPPPAVHAHQRAHSQPIGPKEDERLRREDHREVEEEQL